MSSAELGSRSGFCLDADRYRGDFPILTRETRPGVPLVYLDNAASSQRPNSVIDAMTDCYANHYANVHRGIHTLSEESTDAFEAARQTVASFIGAGSAREVIFTAGATAAINLVARSWGDAFVAQDDVILTTIMEHHANIVPWQQLSQRCGCQLQFVTITDDGHIDLDGLTDALQKWRPKLLAITATSNVFGTLNPVQQIVAAAHDAGTLVLVDAAQAAPHEAMNVVDSDADFVVFSGHKVCGPSGIGVLFGKQALLEAMPPFLGGGAMIHSVTTDGFEPAVIPEKFEAGTPPIAEAIGLAAAIEYVSSIGLNLIQKYEQQLASLTHDLLSDVEGVRILGPSPDQKAGIVSFVVDQVHPHDMSQWLDRQGIAIRAGHHCAMPLHQHLGLSASCRASFYFYNTPDEVAHFAQGVAQAIEKFSRHARRRQ